MATMIAISDPKNGKPKKRLLVSQSVSPPIWDKEQYPRISAGRHLVRVVGFQGPEWVRSFSRWSLRLECMVVDEGVSLSIFFNFAGTPAKMAIPGRQSKYHQSWV